MLLLLLLDPVYASACSMQVLQIKVVGKGIRDLLKRGYMRKFRVAGWAVVAAMRWRCARAVRAVSDPMQLPVCVEMDPNETAEMLDMAFESAATVTLSSQQHTSAGAFLSVAIAILGDSSSMLVK